MFKMSTCCALGIMIRIRLVARSTAFVCALKEQTFTELSRMCRGYLDILPHPTPALLLYLWTYMGVVIRP